MNEELLGKYLLGEANPEEREEVDRWLKLPENQREYDRLQKLWAASEFQAQASSVDVEAAWQKVNQQISTDKSKIRQLSLRQKFDLNPYLRIAAVVLFASLLGLVYYLNQSSQTTLLASSELIEATLPDGSLVSINKNSRLSFKKNFKGDSREVVLEGEAFFEVEPDPNKPFIIEAGSARVEVIGTSFNVKAYPSDREVIVVVEHGTVKLGSLEGNDAILLEAGESGVYLTDEGSIRKKENIDPRSSYWKDRILKFKRTELEKVADVLNEIYDVEIKFDNEKLKNCKLTATFKNLDIQAILKLIAETFELSFTKQDKIIVLSGEGC